MAHILALEAVQSRFFQSIWQERRFLDPVTKRLPVFAREHVLPDLAQLNDTPPSPKAEQAYFCAQLLFVEALLFEGVPCHLVTGYWHNFPRVFDGAEFPFDIQTALATLVLDFQDVKEASDINNRLFWQTMARRDPTVRVISCTKANWGDILSVEVTGLPPAA